MHAQQRELWPETAHLSLNPSYPGIFICCCTAIASLLWTLDHYITTQNKEKTPLHRQGEVFCATPANVARGFTSPLMSFIQRENGHGLGRSHGRIVSHFQPNVSTRKSTEGITYLEMCSVIRKIHQHPLPCYKYLFWVKKKSSSLRISWRHYIHKHTPWAMSLKFLVLWKWRKRTLGITREIVHLL